MAIFLKIIAAISLGIYTSFGLHYYSLLVSRTRNEAVRLLLFLATVALFIGGPLASLAGHLFKRAHANLTIILTPCWICVVLVYLVLNWRTFDQRVRTPRSPGGADVAVGK
jgi:predicted MFS family arabinose efflux permease